ncbi:sulfotransferase [Gammaproteobacteria bacterium]|nr:sulfotransferase [Gammaproteobacteria bacterium]
MKVREAIIEAKKLFQEKEYKKSLKLYLSLSNNLPNDPGVKSFIGNIYRELNQLNDSHKYLEDAYKIKKSIATAINLSNTLKALKIYNKAEEILLNHINETNEENFHLLLNNLSVIKDNQGYQNDAIDYLERALEIEPNFTPAMINLANILKSYDFSNTINLERAESLYKKAIELDPTSYSSYVNLLDLLHKTNRLVEIPKLIKSIPNKIKDLNIFNVYLGCSLNDEKRFDEASRLLSNFSLLDESDIQLIKFEPIRLYFLARSYDGLKKFNLAYKCFKQSKEITFNDPKYSLLKKDKFLNMVAARFEFFESNSNLETLTNNYPENKKTKYFITGFPRSGTTLIDTILRSHNNIHSMEEKGSLKRTISKFSNSMMDLSYLENLDAPSIESVRKFYEDDISRYYDNSKNIQIDRHPFHCIYAGEIKKIFPNSKIIFVTRNPLDVIFSCFTQNFKPQISTANFQNISDSQNLYEKCMKLWFLTSEILNIECHYIKYEDIIADFDNSILGVLEFLECEWDDSLKEYYETAKNRSIIKTASHSQVTKPLYKSSIEKWKDYIEFFDMKDDFTKLNQISLRFGYEPIT